ncbi:McrB family protein [Rhizobium rhizogenes]|uniref:McrB family protein n=1 Tax=Rhizobium rhizogenes TaxID=359 RepID=UPI0015725617|nr:AAA family ATPase [Rhizobium rhizogenes]NTF83613.1 AAA domain-containing protein [Rhizobium rhizogenes]
MQLVDLLTNKNIANIDTLKAEARKKLDDVFDPDRWLVEIVAEPYTAENKASLWKNEMRKPLKAALEGAGKAEADFAAWLGDIHYVNLRIAPRRIFEKNKSNEGWRISVLSLPAGQVTALGIASHYQGTQNQNALGPASGLLHDMASEGLPPEMPLPGRKAMAADWDGAGLFINKVTQVAGVQIPPEADGGELALKNIRTTTIKKILSSFIALETVSADEADAEFLARLERWRDVAWKLATDVSPFSSVHEFEPVRSLALQDLAAASYRMQMRRTSTTRSMVRIYYGPPGTGKTLTAVREAVKRVEPAFDDKGEVAASFLRFNELSGNVAFVTFHQALQYEDAIESIRPVISAPPELEAEVDDEETTNAAPSPQDLGYRLHEGVLLRMIRAAIKAPAEEFVVVIDEINRGDISRILGPLISSLEPDKRLGAEYPIGIELQYPRAESLESRLFVPSNFHIIGTMNSADRNIALVDHALRRRFEFVAILPEPQMLHKTSDDNPIDLRLLLGTLNARISHLIGPEYAIGHGYFMSCKTNNDVVRVMSRKIIPLLNEYFFGSLGLMLLVLSESPSGSNNMHIISEAATAFDTLFNLPKDVASALGYRSHEASVGVKFDPRFWNDSRIIAGPEDEEYAASAVRKIYQAEGSAGG